MEDGQKSVVVRVREFLAARRRFALVVGLLTGVFLLFMYALGQNHPPVHQSTRPSPAAGWGENSEGVSVEMARPGEGNLKAPSAAPLGMTAELYRSGPGDIAGAVHEPRIAYSAELSVVTREFAHSRASLEEILERHRGYTARLRMVGQPSGSVLTAMLRVPTSEYRSALTEFKSVGVLEHEEEAADEITQQHSELDARLVNAQNEEQRILRLLQDKDKAGNLDLLQRQVALLRGEIERMQTERYSSDNRVTFANVSFSLREERALPAETIAAKLRNAAAGGFSEAFESISTILVFLAGRGPLLALWAALLFFPARFFWRRWSQLTFNEAEPSKNS
ncbi:MAG TPA: DUF4349 domain-containing protein [Candidatus Angelobacter sp.]|nr:DUF4349 domain-containing protein [Candidatus Angelobacter sp.]